MDVFTRKAYAEPMKNKTTEVAKVAFEKIVQDTKPRVIFHDDGNEFKGSFDKFADKENIISIENKYGDKKFSR